MVTHLFVFICSRNESQVALSQTPESASLDGKHYRLEKLIWRDYLEGVGVVLLATLTPSPSGLG